MGLMNVYNFANITNWHLPFRFKATFQPTPSFAVGDDIQSFSVKSISKPHYSLGTDAINQYYGTTRFVMPTIEFDKATMDITYVEEEDGDIQYSLLNTLGNALTNGSDITNIRIDEYDIGMTKILSSRVYTCQLKSIDMPDYTRSGNASIMTVTAHYIVHAIYNTSLDIQDLQYPTSQKAIKGLDRGVNQSYTGVSTENPVQEINPPAISKKPKMKMVGDDPLVIDANKKKAEAEEKTNEQLNILMTNMTENLDADKLDEAYKAGMKAYKDELNHGLHIAGVDPVTGSSETEQAWDNLDDSTKMRYILKGLVNVDLSDSIDMSDDTKDSQGLNEAQRLAAGIQLLTGVDVDIATKAESILATLAENEANATTNLKTAMTEAQANVSAENAANMKEYNDSLAMYGLKTDEQLAAEENKNQATIAAQLTDLDKKTAESNTDQTTTKGNGTFAKEAELLDIPLSDITGSNTSTTSLNKPVNISNMVDKYVTIIDSIGTIKYTQDSAKADTLKVNETGDIVLNEKQNNGYAGFDCSTGASAYILSVDNKFKTFLESKNNASKSSDRTNCNGIQTFLANSDDWELVEVSDITQIQKGDVLIRAKDDQGNGTSTNQRHNHVMVAEENGEAGKNLKTIEFTSEDGAKINDTDNISGHYNRKFGYITGKGDGASKYGSYLVYRFKNREN